MDRATCETCRWWRSHWGDGPKPSVPAAGAESGYCRKHAPVAGVGFPGMPADGWCGDHSPPASTPPPPAVPGSPPP